MKKRILNSLIALTLIVSVLFSVLPVSAMAAGSLVPTGQVDQLAQRSSMLNSMYDYITSTAGDGLALDKDFGDYARMALSEMVCHPVNEVSYRTLESICAEFNNTFASKLLAKYESYGVNRTVAQSVFGGWKQDNTGYATLALDRVSYQQPIYRLRSSVGGEWIVNADGSFPYALKGGFTPDGSTGTTSAIGKVLPTNKWVDVRAVDTKNINMITKDNLGSMVTELCSLPASEGGAECTLYKMSVNGTPFWFIMRSTSSSMSLYCSSTGKPYAAAYEPAAINQDFNYTQQVVIDTVDQSTTENNIDLSRPIDLSNGTFYFIDENGDRITQNIDSVNFNFDDRSYTLNTYDVDYDEENNYYTYNYYTYNVQYTYNNTYVTYIGSTAEYQPVEYELYYELPDGRSSADLTEADVAGLSFQFADVVNYKRSATDVSLRALYHFDGDTDDASFFSKEDSFTWDKSASLTYMESNNFGGALYLDEKEHQFTLTLPNALGSKDWTLQWRYYQNSAVTSEHNENYVTVGGVKLLGWSEQSLYSMGSSKLSTGLSIGTWQELALIRNGNTVYMYHNGVRIGSASMSTILTDKIVFYFGANSKAYAMIDELRVTNFPIVKSGASYTPTVVPYDTNSVLVLPDGAVPVADEYWSWDKTINPVFSLDMTTGYLTVPARTKREQVYDGGYIYRDHWGNIRDYARGAIFCGPYQTVATYDGFSRFSGSAGGESYRSPGITWLWSGGVVVQARGIGIRLDIPFNKTYTITLVDSDLNRYSHTCKVPKSAGYSTAVFSSSASFDWGSLGLREIKALAEDSDGDSYVDTNVLFCSLDIKAGKYLDLIYLEVVEGDTPNTGHEYVTAVYDKTELQPNTAAIQTDIPVKGYTVGGVRPTFPVRGDVWFPVESNRISGVYIYNGRSWEQVNARWWTGSRWIPIYAFDIVTLQDMWDVNGADGDKLQSTITSEYSFWNWWQKSWNDFTAKLFGFMGSGSGGGGSGSDSGAIPDGSFPSEPGDDGEDGWSVLDLLKALKDGTWKIVTGTVKVAFGGVVGIVTSVVSIGNFFDAAGDLSDAVNGGIEWPS